MDIIWQRTVLSYCNISYKNNPETLNGSGYGTLCTCFYFVSPVVSWIIFFSCFFLFSEFLYRITERDFLCCFIKTVSVSQCFTGNAVLEDIFSIYTRLSCQFELCISLVSESVVPCSLAKKKEKKRMKKF